MNNIKVVKCSYLLSFSPVLFFVFYYFLLFVWNSKVQNNIENVQCSWHNLFDLFHITGHIIHVMGSSILQFFTAQTMAVGCFMFECSAHIHTGWLIKKCQFSPSAILLINWILSTSQLLSTSPNMTRVSRCVNCCITFYRYFELETLNGKWQMVNCERWMLDDKW